MTSLGHAHPAVAEAVAAAGRHPRHVSNLYKNALAPEVAATLDRLVGGGSEPAGGQVFFCNSGAEANECAIKLARRWAGPGRHRVVAALGLLPRPDPGHAGRDRPAREARRRSPRSPRASPTSPSTTSTAWRRPSTPRPLAAVLLEPIQGEGGVNVPSSDYLAGVRKLCDDRGVLLIADEIQTGLGRTGRWFAFQAQDLQPDVVTIAKALGNGMPVGACWARAEVAAAFGPGDHGSTFGGQPLALSAARATLAVMEAEDVCGRATRAGARLAAGLAALPGVIGVRGQGLLLAAQLDDEASEGGRGPGARGAASS